MLLLSLKPFRIQRNFLSQQGKKQLFHNELFFYFILKGKNPFMGNMAINHFKRKGRKKVLYVLMLARFR